MIPTSWIPCSSIRLLMQVSTSALSVDPGGYGWLPGGAAQYYPASDESDRGQQAQEHFPAREREHSAVFAFTFACGGGQSLFKSLTLVHGSGDHTGQFIQRIQGVRIPVLMNGSVRLVGFQRLLGGIGLGRRPCGVRSAPGLPFWCLRLLHLATLHAGSGGLSRGMVLRWTHALFPAGEFPAPGGSLCASVRLDFCQYVLGREPGQCLAGGQPYPFLLAGSTVDSGCRKGRGQKGSSLGAGTGVGGGRRGGRHYCVQPDLQRRPPLPLQGCALGIPRQLHQRSGGL